MKLLILLPALLLLSCGAGRYTSSAYFDCDNKAAGGEMSDRQMLYHKILERSVVVKKDITEYASIADKKRIYVSDTVYSTFFSTTIGGSDIEKRKLHLSDIPGRIGDVRFCLKSKAELQEIANAAGDFMYLTIEDAVIAGDTAIVGIANMWMQQDATKPWMQKDNGKEKYIYMSGGGYTLKFVKVNGEWIFHEGLRSWQS